MLDIELLKKLLISQLIINRDIRNPNISESLISFSTDKNRAVIWVSSIDINEPNYLIVLGNDGDGWQIITSELYHHSICLSIIMSGIGDHFLLGLSNYTGNSDGAVVVYKGYNNNTSYSSSQRIYSINPGKNDKFGATLKLIGNKLLIGAPMHNSAEITNSGCVYVYELENNLFNIKQMITKSNSKPFDFFGLDLNVIGYEPEKEVILNIPAGILFHDH